MVVIWEVAALQYLVLLQSKMEKYLELLLAAQEKHQLTIMPAAVAAVLQAWRT